MVPVELIWVQTVQHTDCTELVVELWILPERIIYLADSSTNGFTLHKGDFQDALALHYGWKPSKLPAKCTCRSSFNMEHALSWAFHQWDPWPDCYSPHRVCNDVRAEPDLQLVIDEALTGATANARPAANGVWGGILMSGYLTLIIRLTEHPSPLPATNGMNRPRSMHMNVVCVKLSICEKRPM